MGDKSRSAKSDVVNGGKHAGPLTIGKGLPSSAEATASVSRDLTDPVKQAEVIEALPRLHKDAGRPLSAAFIEFWLDARPDSKWLIITGEQGDPYEDSSGCSGLRPYLRLTTAGRQHVFSFPRAVDALDQLHKLLRNAKSWPIAGLELTKSKEKDLRELKTVVGSFGYFKPASQPKVFLGSITVYNSANGLADPDDLDASLGVFLLQVYAQGTVVDVGGEKFVESVKYGIRVGDNFEFCNESKIIGKVVSQYLGLWSLKDGYIPFNQSQRAYAYLNNAAFRRYSGKKNTGNDFIVVTEMEEFDPGEKVRIKLA